MKTKNTYILLALIILAATVTFAILTKKDIATEQRNIIVSASFYPLAFLAQEIAGETFTVHTITPNNVEPHDYEPTAADIAKLTKSKLFIHTGAHIESWGARLSGLVTAEGGTAITIVNPETALRFEGEHEEEAEHNKEEAHADELDPHVWISPKRAIEITRTITGALVKLDPAHVQAYTENSARTVATLTEIDKNYNRVLSTCAKRELVTSHDAFGYLAHDYNLEVHPIAGISPEAEPSPQDLAAITRLVGEKNVTHIFMEELGTPKLVETVARETGAQILELSPIESAQDGRTLYAQMNQNLENLKIALQCTQ